MAQATVSGSQTSEPHNERRELYEQGLSDQEIADVVGVGKRTICSWRTRAGLPSNLPQGRNRRTTLTTAITPELKRRCLALLERGLSARLIAREAHVGTCTIDTWRKALMVERPDLPIQKNAHRPTRRHANGNPFSKLRSDRRAAAFLLYADGVDDHAIAAALGIVRQQVWEWRHALYLPAVRRSGVTSRVAKPTPPRKAPAPSISPLANPIHARIMSAIGRSVAPDIAEDAASDMWVALLEGRLSEADIGTQAGAYRGRTINAFADKYGDRSLDEDMGDRDGFRMLDMIRDERSSDWLEENGATVW